MWLIGGANSNARFALFMDITTYLEGHYFADSDASIALRVSQMLGSSKVALLCANNKWTDRRQTKPIA